MFGCAAQRPERTQARAGAAAPPLTVHAVPDRQPLDGDFTVRAREPGGVWRDVGVYLADVDFLTPSETGLVTLDASGPVEVAVTRTDGTMQSARVRPSRYGISPRLSDGGRTATFTLPRPLDVSFEPDGDTLHNVHVFVSPPEAAEPRPAGRVISFGPGVHELPGDHVLRVGGNTTVVLAGGAVLRGAIKVVGSHVTIQGHGVIDPTPVFDPKDGPPTIDVTGHADVGIRDVTILNSVGSGVLLVKARRVTIARLRMINAARWTDGIDIVAGSEDVLIEDSFLRTADDSVAVYGSTPWGVLGSTRGVTVRNSVLWPDVAHAVLVGTHGDPHGRDAIEHLLFSDLDVLEHDENSPLYQGALAVNAGDHVNAGDIQFENVRIDRISLGRMFDVRVFLNPDYNSVPGTGVHDVLYRNVSYGGTADMTSRVAGYDGQRRVRGVTFENVRRDGRLLGRGDVAVGDDADGVVFGAAPRSVMRDDDDPIVRYRGRWRVESAAGAAGGTQHVTASASASAVVTFRGHQARLYGALSPDGGAATVQVDGGRRHTIDTYAPVARMRELWLDTGRLARGRHVIRIRSTASRNRLSSGRRVALDRVEVVP